MTHEYWYLSRAAGFTAYLLTFASVVAGMTVSTKLGARLRLGNLPFDLHRFLSLLALAFTLFHVFVLLGDRYLHFTVADLWVPFASPYRPVAVATGVIAAWMMMLIVASFYVRRFIGHHAWRLMHFGTFGMYVLATAHGLFAGTDTGAGWARDVYLLTLASILMLTAYRLDNVPGKKTVSETRRIFALTSAGAGFMVTLVASAFLGSSLVSVAVS